MIRKLELRVLMAHCGLRPVSLGNYRGTDGLRIRDLPEMTIKEGVVEFTKIPTMVVVRAELSKSQNQYFTFLGEEGTSYLKDYLEERILNGDELLLESPIITPKQGMKPFIRTVNVGDIVRSAIRKSSFRWRPYMLRAYFDTQLLLAENNGKISHAYRVFLMGHHGDIEDRYTTDKRRLPPDLIEDMRRSYQKCLEFLDTNRSGTDEEKLKIALRRQLLLVAGYNRQELDKTDLTSATDEDIKRMLRKRLLGEKANDHRAQKVVPADKVESYLNGGWEFVASLSNGNIILRFPPE